jgi:hypothetical protein
MGEKRDELGVVSRGREALTLLWDRWEATTSATVQAVCEQDPFPEVLVFEAVSGLGLGVPREAPSVSVPATVPSLQLPWNSLTVAENSPSGPSKA